MSELRLFIGTITMREDTSGATSLHNEHWAGWFSSSDAAAISWIKATTEKHPNGAMSSYCVNDITHIALTNLEWSK